VSEDPPIDLVTGASGYIGGRLTRHLISTGGRIRCMGRDPEVLRGRFGDDVERVFGDVVDTSSLRAALKGIDTAYYLIHGLGETGDFESLETRGAENFAMEARAAGVRRLVYLGGLGDAASAKSAHMRSRHAVGDILRESGIPTVELRASVVIGAGSLSFEMIRSLVRRLPVMIAPRWVRVEAQPIAVNDVLCYLEEARRIPTADHCIYEIGGAEILSYRDLMLRYAASQDLRRKIIDVPFLTPWLSSLWLNLVTPLNARIGRKLISSICVASVVKDTRAMEDFNVRPMGIDAAIESAHREEELQLVSTHWTDAVSASGRAIQWGGIHLGARIVDERKVDVSVPADTAFHPIQRIGGTTGWYYADFLWKVRGLLDKLVGGVGLSRGRKHPQNLSVGDSVDWWRVEAIEPGQLLVLRAEMRLPGRAWLRFEVESNESGTGSTINQTAIFDPHGLAGLAYWYTLYPLHEIIFAGMSRNIAHAAESVNLGEDLESA
jgi:uncharacterized protein YbjT (DUF2867 family)